MWHFRKEFGLALIQMVFRALLENTLIEVVLDLFSIYGGTSRLLFRVLLENNLIRFHIFYMVLEAVSILGTRHFYTICVF